MIAPRIIDVYVLDMRSSAQESCFFAKAFENLNWLWHKRLAHLNFKTINQLTKENLVYLLHMDLFGPVTPRSINHEKYTLVIVDEYSRYKSNQKDVTFIEPCECSEPIVLETKVQSDQNGQADQNDHNDQNDQYVQIDEILNDDQSKYFNHTNDEQIIDNLLTPQDRWSQDKHIELVNIIGDLGARMLTRAMAKELGAASAHECLFVDFLSIEEPKKVSEALKHPRRVDAMQDKL
ncbi:retrovirus-related pol polyprotein from transposon TNT 1-94 [Tanacetum coccineum]